LPGIKLARHRPAGIKLNRFSLAVVALLFSYPAAATESLAAIQILEWGADASSTAADVSSASASQDDVWQRIRNGFKIEDATPNPLVAVHESWYAARPESVRRMVDRARRYLFHIVEEVDRRAMPMEIALLPMIESAFNPTALSPSAASGIWQFIPPTGRLYGLKQDNWYDGRRDFTAATRLRSTTWASCISISATGSWRWRPTTVAKAASRAPSRRTSSRDCPPITPVCPCPARPAIMFPSFSPSRT